MFQLHSQWLILESRSFSLHLWAEGFCFVNPGTLWCRLVAAHTIPLPSRLWQFDCLVCHWLAIACKLGLLLCCIGCTAHWHTFCGYSWLSLKCCGAMGLVDHIFRKQEMPLPVKWFAYITICDLAHSARWTMSRVDIPAHARTAPNGLQKRLEEDLCRIILHVPLMTWSAKGLNWTDSCALKL